MDSIKTKLKGDEYEYVLYIPQNQKLADILTSKIYCGYRYKCVVNCLKTTIYLIGTGFYNKKQRKIGALLYNLDKDIITYEQYGYENQHNCISVYSDIFTLLRAQDFIRIKGANKKCRVVYSAPIIRLLTNGVQSSDEKFTQISKKFLTQSLEKY